MNRRAFLQAAAIAASTVALARPAFAAPSTPVAGFVVWSDSTGQTWPHYTAASTGLPLYNGGKDTIVGASRVGESLERLKSFPFAEYPNYGHICISGHVDCNRRYNVPEVVAPTHKQMADLVAAKLGRADRFASIALTNDPETGAVDNPDFFGRVMSLAPGSTSVNAQLSVDRGPYFMPLHRRMGTTADPLRYLQAAGLSVTDEDIRNVQYDKCPPDTMRVELPNNPGHWEDVGKRYVAQYVEGEFVRLGWYA